MAKNKDEKHFKQFLSYLRRNFKDYDGVHIEVMKKLLSGKCVVEEYIVTGDVRVKRRIRIGELLKK